MQPAFSITRRRAMLASTATLLGGFAPMARAAWPESTITLIVPWAPGGSTDI